MAYKSYFVTMLWALAISGALLLSFPMAAHAGRATVCGDVDKGLIKNIYAAARRVDYIVDVKGAMNSFCGYAQKLERWEKDLPREVRTKEYKRERRNIIKSAESDLKILKGHLITLKTWNAYDPHDTTDRVLRRSRMKKAKKRVLSSIMVMGQYAGQIQLLMNKYSIKK